MLSLSNYCMNDFSILFLIAFLKVIFETPDIALLICSLNKCAILIRLEL